MNKTDAKTIAKTITNEQLKQMFDAAKIGILDWKKPSSVNKGMTKGTSWNILAKGFDIKENYHLISKKNMIREFGDFLPSEIKPTPKTKQKASVMIHQEPDF
jgi:hypothetical protein